MLILLIKLILSRLRKLVHLVGKKLTERLADTLDRQVRSAKTIPTDRQISPGSAWPGNIQHYEDGALPHINQLEMLQYVS